MGFYQFRKEQLLPAGTGEVWDFISSPHNLERITPPNMGFTVLSAGLPEKMYAGMIISYSVRPLWRIRTHWVSEITQVVPQQYFVDEQRIGPYAMWHHQHIIEPCDNGVLMTDIVSYQPPLGFLGRIANALLIRKKLEEIFAFRQKALEKIFPR